MDAEDEIPEGLDPEEEAEPTPKRRPRRKGRGSGGSKPKELLEAPVQVHRQWATSDYRWQETLDFLPTRREVYDRFGAGKYRLDCQGGGRVYWILQRRPGVNSRSSEAHMMDDDSPADELSRSRARGAELESKLNALAAAAPHAQPQHNPWAPPTQPQPQAAPWPTQAPAWPPTQPQPQAGPPPGYVWHPQQGWIQMAAPAPQFAPSAYHPSAGAGPLGQLREFAEYKRLMDELWPDGVARGDDGDDGEWDDEPEDLQGMIAGGIRDFFASRFKPPAPSSATPPIAVVPNPTAPPAAPAAAAPGALPGETPELAAELVTLAGELGQDAGAVRALAHDRGYTAEQAVTIGRQLVAQARQAAAS